MKSVLTSSKTRPTRLWRVTFPLLQLSCPCAYCNLLRQFHPTVKSFFWLDAGISSWSKHSATSACSLSPASPLFVTSRRSKCFELNLTATVQTRSSLARTRAPFMMAEEPTLPRLPSPLASGSRGKRTFGEGVSSPELSTSSDPAFFSSDDDPALDNYQGQGRRKRRYVGAWFDQHPASSDSGVDDETRATHVSRRNRARPRPKKREFRRQLDSGVWMGTDGALTDTDDGVDLEPVPARLPLVPRQTPAPVPLAPARPRLSVAEEAVQNTVLRCLDNGNELVDLRSV
jgi:hypothetical protein